MPIKISNFQKHVAKMHQDRNKGFELEYDVCGMHSAVVCDYVKFLSCCSPSVKNPKHHI